MKMTILALGASIPAVATATTLNIFESPDLVTPFDTIETIETTGSGADHYNWFSYSAHPEDVPLAPLKSWLWVHESTISGEFTFGFAFDKDDSGSPSNDAAINFRVIDSTSDVYVSQSDDPGEALEVAPGIFEGNYRYADNTDGIAVSGITGSDWTIIVDSVDFGDVTGWSAASGSPDSDDDVSLTLGMEYRITPLDAPSDVPVGVPDTGATLALFGLSLAGLGFGRRFFG